MTGIPHVVSLRGSYDVANVLRAIGTKDRSFCIDAGGRYTFAGCAPVATLKSSGPFIERTFNNETLLSCDDPLRSTRTFVDLLSKLPKDPYLPFYGGLVGFVGFEWGTALRGETDTSMGDLPDAWFGVYDTVVVLDHVEGSGYVASLGLDATLTPRLDLAKARADALLALLGEPTVASIAQFMSGPFMVEDLIPVSPRRRYREIARDLKKYLQQGNVQRLNLAPRYVGLVPDAPWEIHARLRAQNPTPYGMYLDPGTFQLCSLSPTAFLTQSAGMCQAKPVLGFWPHDAKRDLPDPAQWLDQTPSAIGLLHRLREELSQLSGAENSVLQGLPLYEEDSRNVHLVCPLTVKLQQELSVFDALARMVPGLSMTGFPKTNAMQWLQAHEPFRRHAYTGAMGYWSPNGTSQFNLSVRLLTVRDGLGYVHSASWFDAHTDIDEALDATDTGMTKFFSQLHHLPIHTIHEQSLY